MRRRELTILRQLLMAAAPQEGCALLLGGPAGDPLPAPSRPADGRQVGPDPVAAAGARAEPPVTWEIRLIWPCLNVWQPAPERRHRFALDPREQLLAQRWGRERGLQVLGSAHSHPHSAAVPSATDLALAFAPTLQLILSPLQGWQPACWWLESTTDDHPRARPLRWRMVD